MVKRAWRAGFTLIEMLCVMAIISILASLLLGAVSRAYGRVKRFDWENKANVLVERFQDRMKAQFGSAPKYPALTIEQLYEGGLIDSHLRDFLKDKKVQFFPFSSETPETNVILAVTISKKSGYVLVKRDIIPNDR